MKKILLIVLSLIISNLSYANESDLYLEKLNKYDDKFYKLLDENFKDEREYYSSTEKSTKFNYDLRECYESVAYEIIDKYYEKEAKKIKSKLKNITSEIYYIEKAFIDKYAKWDRQEFIDSFDEYYS